MRVVEAAAAGCSAVPRGDLASDAHHKSPPPPARSSVATSRPPRTTNHHTPARPKQRGDFASDAHHKSPHPRGRDQAMERRAKAAPRPQPRTRAAGNQARPAATAIRGTHPDHPLPGDGSQARPPKNRSPRHQPRPPTASAGTAPQPRNRARTIVRACPRGTLCAAVRAASGVWWGGPTRERAARVAHAEAPGTGSPPEAPGTGSPPGNARRGWPTRKRPTRKHAKRVAHPEAGGTGGSGAGATGVIRSG
jgi:hypothetical protein